MESCQYFHTNHHIQRSEQTTLFFLKVQLLLLQLPLQLHDTNVISSSGAISSGDLTLDFILDERSRELYWEGLRRTDLIRYNRFTSSSYLWPFKGNEATGVGVDEYRNLFPLPANVVAINSNLTQNEGY